MLPSGEPEVVRRRLDTLAASMLPRVWDEDFFEQSDDQTLYFIERVDSFTEIDLDALDDRALASAWAESMRRAIAEAIIHGDGVVIFRHRAEYLAAYIQELLHQGAGKWYFREPDSVMASAALGVRMMALLADADTGRDVLLELARRGELEVFLAALSDDEAATIVDSCLMPPSARLSLPRRYGIWLEALRETLNARGRRTMTMVRARDLARLYCDTVARRPDLGPDVNLARFVNDLLSVRTALRLGGSAAVLRALRSDDDIADAAQRLRGGITDSGRSSGGSGQEGVPPELVELLRTIVREDAGSLSAAVLSDLGAEAPIAHQYATQFGGLFLLAPAMVELGIVERLDAIGGTASRGLLAWWMVLQCLGRDHMEAARRDGALRMLAGVTGAINAERISRYCIEAAQKDIASSLSEIHRSLPPIPPHLSAAGGREWTTEDFMLGREAGMEDIDAALAPLAAEVLRRFAVRLGAFADSSPAYLRRNFLQAYAVAEVDTDITVRLLRCPLQMVLRMAGFESLTAVLPWLAGRTISFRFE